jgi:xanthine dehydrogenase YagS FAD-binding subunit
VREFGYERASGVAGAVAAVAQGGPGAAYLAGGTNLVDLMKSGVLSPDLLVDVRRLPLDAVEEGPDGGLRIGATATNSDLAAHPLVRTRFPALAQAVLAGASGQLRNAATVGGNLLQRVRCGYFTDLASPCNRRAPGTGCPALTGEHHNHAVLGSTSRCAAVHPSDMAVPLAAFDAVVHWEGPDGPGEAPFAGFHAPDPELPHVETVLPPGALITAVTLPGAAVAARSRYRKVRERASYAFANAAVAAALAVEDGVVREVRLALGAVAARPWRARTAEAALLGRPAVAASFAAAAEAELAAARPLPENGYKVPLVRNVMVSVLSELAEEAAR